MIIYIIILIILYIYIQHTDRHTTYTQKDINIFLLCYNESILLPHTIKHYKTYLPNCKITIYDNYSTDNSVQIAKQLGCNVIKFNSNNELNEFTQTYIKNNCWKHITNGWIIVADMDEWLCITEKKLEFERKKGTSILKIKGLEMIGKSNTTTLNDIDLHNINKITPNHMEDKHLCFLKDKITNMNYGGGAHKSNPTGDIKYSNKVYINKHMCFLGLPFLQHKMIKRHQRTHNMRKLNIATHYINDLKEIKKRYKDHLKNSQTIDIYRQ